MLGAIIGDVVGSIYEFHNTRNYDFELFSEDSSFTDDTICTIAVADAILNGMSYKDSIIKWCKRYPYPMGSYGVRFNRWLYTEAHEPYGSYGNGSAMRVSPVAWAFDTKKDVLEEAGKTALITHNHIDGVTGAMAVAAVIFALRNNPSAETIRIVGGEYYPEFWKAEYNHEFDETCQGTVPLCLKIAKESSSFEDAIRRAISWGGDSDTIGAIVGSIAQARFSIPNWIREEALKRLPEDMIDVINKFENKFMSDYKYF